MALRSALAPSSLRASTVYTCRCNPNGTISSGNVAGKPTIDISIELGWCRDATSSAIDYFVQLT